MIDLKTLSSAVNQIAAEKGIAAEKIMEALEAALAAAYKREYRERGEAVKAKFDLKSGKLDFWQVKTVVDESTVRMAEEGELAEGAAEEPRKSKKPAEPKKSEEEGEEEKKPVYNSLRHIFLDEAKKIKKDVQLGDELEFPLESHDDFGRIAAQTAKQVILQKLREAERESVMKEFRGKEGEIVSGIIQRFERGGVYVDLGRVIGVMFHNETIQGEHYRAGDRMRFYVLAVQEPASGLPGIILSRSHPKFVHKLFELEVPEIADGVIEIKLVSREAGSRTKIAVASNDERVDPVGSCVGQRGTRVMAVTNELGQEKIDIIEWSEEPEKFIASALSPAKVKLVEILPRREARVLVPEDQLSLAIGRGGQNVRLAAKLTGWKIDVRSQSRPEEVHEGGVAEVAEENQKKEGEEATSADGQVRPAGGQ